MSYFPLDRDILTSSVWAEGSPQVVKVWFYLLLAANPRTGFVEDADPAIALRCGLPLSDVTVALDWLAQPDPHSRSKAREGRRIERLPKGGIMIVNYLRRKDKDYSTLRVKRWRERKPNETVKRSSETVKRSETVAGNAGNDEQEQEQEQTEQQRTPRGAPPAVAGQSVNAVFEHWKAVTGKKAAKLTPKRERKVRQRLKEGYTVEHLRRAIDGNHASAYHRGKNDTSTVYDDLELICRDGEHVEMFMTHAGDSGPPDVSPEEAGRIRTARALAAAGVKT